ncbi:MAG: trypsin-like serine protease [Pseudoruegeria sp.]
MRFFSILILFFLVWGNVAPASDLRALETADKNKGWEAVGRLNIGDRSMCTGALIAPDLVLTAAHCLFDRESGVAIDPTTIQFLAGWRNGRASAYRSVKTAAVHSDYQMFHPSGAARVRNDVALLKLDQPIRNSSIRPFEVKTDLQKGDQVGVVSYAQNRAEHASLQEVCHVLGQQAGAVVLSCNVDFGSSGAPVFVVDNGVAKVATVVSAKADMGAQKVALATELFGSVPDLMADIADQTRFGGARPKVRRLSLSEDRHRSGARFLRP